MHVEPTAPDKMRHRSHLRLIVSDGEDIAGSPNDDASEAIEMAKAPTAPVEAAWIEDVSPAPETLPTQDEPLHQANDIQSGYDDLARAVEAISLARDALDQDAARHNLSIRAVTYRRPPTHGQATSPVSPVSTPAYRVTPRATSPLAHRFCMTVVVVAVLLLVAGVVPNFRW